MLAGNGNSPRRAPGADGDQGVGGKRRPASRRVLRHVSRRVASHVMASGSSVWCGFGKAGNGKRVGGGGGSLLRMAVAE